jgi:hypothetical protein
VRCAARGRRGDDLSTLFRRDRHARSLQLATTGYRYHGRAVAWVGIDCTMLRTDRPIADVELFGDLADALKHAVLTRKVDARQVRENDAVLAPGTGFEQRNQSRVDSHITLILTTFHR